MELTPPPSKAAAFLFGADIIKTGKCLKRCITLDSLIIINDDEPALTSYTSSFKLPLSWLHLLTPASYWIRSWVSIRDNLVSYKSQPSAGQIRC